jgi:hypothetical protein
MFRTKPDKNTFFDDQSIHPTPESHGPPYSSTTKTVNGIPRLTSQVTLDVAILSLTTMVENNIRVRKMSS